jgi:protoporphyrinogen oxidase
MAEEIGASEIQDRMRDHRDFSSEWQHAKWNVSTEGNVASEEFDAVIMTLPTHAAARLLPDPESSGSHDAAEKDRIRQQCDCCQRPQVVRLS